MQASNFMALRAIKELTMFIIKHSIAL